MLLQLETGVNGGAQIAKKMQSGSELVTDDD